MPASHRLQTGRSVVDGIRSYLFPMRQACVRSMSPLIADFCWPHRVHSTVCSTSARPRRRGAIRPEALDAVSQQRILSLRNAMAGRRLLRHVVVVPPRSFFAFATENFSESVLPVSSLGLRRSSATRRYARILGGWVRELGLNAADYGTHSMRPTKATLIYRRTRNLRAVQLPLGHSKLESTVRYLGIEVDDALEISEQTEI